MQTVEIVRYNNRKLYSRDMSRYVNCSELKEFIDAGYNLKVISNVNGLDVTRQAVGEIIKQCDSDLTKVYLFMLKRAV
ncbi:MAG: polyhydroxyalkanoate synthesis regulator DNA-binding domain-containing protein [Bacteroidales bacterium]